MVSFKQILLPIAIGAGIILAIMTMVEVNNALGFTHMNQLNAGNIAVLAYFIGIAEVAWFGVVKSKDEPTKEDETTGATYETTLTQQAGGFEILDDIVRAIESLKRKIRKK